MDLSRKLRDLDDRAFGRRAAHLRRRTALRLGAGFGLFTVLWYVASYWDDSLGRFAASMALFAGMFLGRVQEHDLARKGYGLRPDGDEPPAG